MEEKDYIASFLKEIIGLPGISGYETPVSNAIARHWQPLTDEIQRTGVGNLYGIRHGKGHRNGKKPRKVIMAAHMDGIGMIVERFSGEMLYFAPVGGFDPRILPGQQVTIHGANGDLPGIIVQLAPHLLSKPYDDKPLPLDELVIDTGLDEEALRAAVRVGDTISYATVPTDMPTDCISGHSLDNRASVAAITQCLKELERFEHEWDVYAVGTTQEETTFLSHTVVEDIQPDIAIVIDVTFAEGPGADGWRTKPLASGPSIGFGANLHPVLYRSLTQLCDKLGTGLYERSGSPACPERMRPPFRLLVAVSPPVCWGFHCATCIPPGRNHQPERCDGCRTSNGRIHRPAG